jgi:hypothetical protein
MLSFKSTRHGSRRASLEELLADGTSVGTATASPRVGTAHAVSFQCGGTFSASFGTGTYSGAGAVAFETGGAAGAVTGSIILSAGKDAVVATIGEGSTVRAADGDGRYILHLVLDVTGGSHRFRHVAGTLLLDGTAVGPQWGPYAVSAELSGSISHHRR